MEELRKRSQAKVREILGGKIIEFHLLNKIDGTYCRFRFKTN
jgi:hypothetical protein